MGGLLCPRTDHVTSLTVRELVPLTRTSVLAGSALGCNTALSLFAPKPLLVALMLVLR